MKQGSTSAKQKVRSSSLQNLPELIFGWLPPVLGVVGWVVGWLHPEEPFLPWVSGIFGLLACVVASVIIHELSHYFAARILGLNPWRLSIGRGSRVFDHQFRGFRLTLRANPYSGRVYHFLLQPQILRVRWKCFGMVLAGPLVNVVLFVVALGFATGNSNALQTSSPAVIQSPIPMEMLVANGYLFLVSMIPFHAKLDGVRVPNDGMQLLLLLVRRGIGLAVQESSKAMSATETAGAEASNPGWHWTVQRLPSEALLVAYRQLLTQPTLSAEDRNQALDGFATCVLMYGVREFLPEADRYSEELLRNKPDEWTVKGTRGSILVERGDLSAGIAMLTEVMEHDPSAFDRAIAASFLALAEWRKNNRESAQMWLRQSLELDPNCASGIRLSALMEGEAESPEGTA